MKQFILSAATALTLVAGFAASTTAAEHASGLDGRVVSYQRLAAIPNSQGCTLVSTEFGGDTRSETIKYVKGDTGCAKTTISARNAGATAFAHPPSGDDVLPLKSKPCAVANGLLTHIDGAGEPVFIVGEARLLDESGRGYASYQLTRDGGEEKIKVVGSRDVSGVGSMTNMRDALAVELAAVPSK